MYLLYVYSLSYGGGSHICGVLSHMRGRIHARMHAWYTSSKDWDPCNTYNTFNHDHWFQWLEKLKVHWSVSSFHVLPLSQFLLFGSLYFPLLLPSTTTISPTNSIKPPFPSRCHHHYHIGIGVLVRDSWVAPCWV